MLIIDQTFNYPIKSNNTFNRPIPPKTTKEAKKIKLKNFILNSVKRIPGGSLDCFAEHLKRRLGEAGLVTWKRRKPDAVVDKLVNLLLFKKIKLNFSLFSLLNDYTLWCYYHRTEPGKKDIIKLNNFDFEALTFDECSMSNEGMTLDGIAKVLDEDRVLSATAINQVINKLIPKNNNEAKLSHLQSILNDTCSDKLTKEYMNRIEAATIKAAGMFVDIIEQAILESDDEIFKAEKIADLLANKGYSYDLSNFDKQRELLFLEVFAGWINNVEFANDDTWKDLIMEALIEDYNFQSDREVPLFDYSREELNIMKSFQNMVAGLVNPPPKPGRRPYKK